MKKKLWEWENSQRIHQRENFSQNNLQVKCGNQIGNAFWDTIIAEHGITERGVFTGPGTV